MQATQTGGKTGGEPDCCRETEPSQVRRDQTISDAIQMPYVVLKCGKAQRGC
jgi:hypothetical protein